VPAFPWGPRADDLLFWEEAGPKNEEPPPENFFGAGMVVWRGAGVGVVGDFLSGVVLMGVSVQGW